jgi:acyl-CoA thioesterase I
VNPVLSTSRRLSLPIAALLLLSACSLRTVACGLPRPGEPVPLTPTSQVPENLAADQSAIKIAFLGDSLTSGFGLLTDESYPSRIQELFAGEGYGEVEVLNGGVSGDTTAGGRRRVEGLLEPGVRILVVALGGNDALRGLAVAQTRENLAAIIDTGLQKSVQVLLVGMEAPTNLGPDYQTAFHDAFPSVAQSFGPRIDFVPFLLEGVAGNPAFNQADGIHPNQAGARKVAEHLYPTLRNIVDRIAGAGGHE